MNRPLKIVAVVAAILVVLVVAVLVLAKLLVTPERIRATVLPLAQEKLQREVELGKIEVSLFSGVVLHNLVVHERGGKEGGEDEPFVAADRVVLSYQFWPLLFMRVVIDEILLETPRIRVVRFADGTFNFSDLSGPEGEKEPREAAAEPMEDPVDLLVSEVVLSEGEVIFHDHALEADTPYRFRLSGVFVNARDISLDKPFPFRVQARLNQASLEVEGEADLDDLQGRAKVLLQDLDVTAFTPYFQEYLPGKLGSLRLNLDLTAEGGREMVESKGHIALNGIELVLDAMQDTPLRNADLALDYMVTADLKASSLEIRETKAALNGIPLHIAGRVEDFAGEPAIDITARLEDLDLNAAVSAAPEDLVRPFAEMNPAGTIQAQLHLAGPVAEPMKLLRDGDLHLNAIEVSSGGLRPSLTGVLNLAGDSLTAEKLLLQLGQNVAAINLRAKNLFGKPIVVRTDITSEEFLLDPLLKAAAAPAATAPPAQADEKAKEQPPTPPVELGPFDIPITAEGSVLVGRGIYQGLTIENFELRYRLENNVLDIQKLTGRTAGGEFNQTGKIDLAKKGLAYAGRVEVSGVQTDPLISALFPKAGGTVFGTLNLTTELNGRGTLPEAIKKNLSGKGAMLLTDGKITGAGLVQGLADFLNLEELRVLQFSRADGSFTVDDGRLRLNSDLKGSNVRMEPTGSVGLDGSLNVALDMALSPELTGRLDSGGKVSRFLTDAEGWGQVPLKVTGTIGTPRFVLDTSAVKGKVQEKAREEIQKKLQEKIFDKLAPPSGEKGEKSLEPAKKSLEDTFKGLFGN
jgi:AsmA protein